MPLHNSQGGQREQSSTYIKHKQACSARPASAPERGFGIEVLGLSGQSQSRPGWTRGEGCEETRDPAQEAAKGSLGPWTRPLPLPQTEGKAALVSLCFLMPSGLPFSEDGAQSSAGGSEGSTWPGERDQRRARPLYSKNQKASLSILLLGGQWGLAQLQADLQPSPRWAGHPAQASLLQQGPPPAGGPQTSHPACRALVPLPTRGRHPGWLAAGARTQEHTQPVTRVPHISLTSGVPLWLNHTRTHLPSPAWPPRVKESHPCPVCRGQHETCRATLRD